MSIAFKPTTKHRQAIRDIITQNTTINLDSLPNSMLQHIIEYCWNTFTASNRYAVAAQYWRGQNPPDQQHQRILVGYYKTAKQAENAAKQFHWNTRLQQQWKTWILPVHNGTVSEHFTNQKTLFDTQTSNQDDSVLPLSLIHI